MAQPRTPTSATDPTREAHSVSLKVLRLSKPSLVVHHPLQAGISTTNSQSINPSASLAYPPFDDHNDASGISSGAGTGGGWVSSRSAGITPLLALPPSFGSAYVGETFSCTLCVNNELDDNDGEERKEISAIRVEAEMKTPAGSVMLDFGANSGEDQEKKDDDEDLPTQKRGQTESGILPAGHSVQKVVSYRLLQEGNHVLAVTIRYTENTPSKGRVRTFRKLYQFVAKGCMVVRTKTSRLPDAKGPAADTSEGGATMLEKRKRWVLEAQLENCGEETLCLQSVVLQTTKGLLSTALNWHVLPDDIDGQEALAAEKPILKPKDIQQVCFLLDQASDELEITQKSSTSESRLTLGQLSIAWTSALGNEGVLLTGWLGTKFT